MSASSGSAQAAPTADELLQNLLDSVTPTSAAGSSTTDESSSKSSSTAATTTTTTAPVTTTTAPATTAATPAPSSTNQSVASTADANSSGGGSSAGLSIGLGVGAVMLVAFVVLYFRQRKRRRYKAPGHDHDLGTPQLSIELPMPPHLHDGNGGNGGNGGKTPGEQRLSVFSSVQNGGEFNAAAEETSPAFHAGMRPAPSAQYRVSNNPQTGPVSTTFRMDASSSAFNASYANPVPDSNKTNKLTRVVSGRVPAAFDNSPSPAAVPVATEGGGSVPRDTNASTSSLNSLHDSMCSDFYKHGDGLGERIRAMSRTKHPSMVLEDDDEDSTRSTKPVPPQTIPTAVPAPVSYRPAPLAAASTPKAFAAAPATPLSAPPVQPPQPPPAPAMRRAPPPPPPAAAFVKPPPIATSDARMYRPSTESEIQFQRLSTMSSESIGSMKRASTSSNESANLRAGSKIEINEIVGGEGSQRAKEIEI